MVRESNTGGGANFRTRLDHTGAHTTSYKMGTGSLPGVKRLGRVGDNPPSPIIEIKE